MRPSIVAAALLTASCTSGAATTTTTTAAPPRELPKVTGVVASAATVGVYEKLELSVQLEAEFSNRFDQREVALESVFSGPGGVEMRMPGFWDGEIWKIRFSPASEGEWGFQVAVTDSRGTSEPVSGSFDAVLSERNGWILPADKVNGEWDGHYLVHHDGTPFYGVGHADPFRIMAGGYRTDGFSMFSQMLDYGANYMVWWPQYSLSLVGGAYDHYTTNAASWDLVVEDAHAKNLVLIMTIWEHPQLRDRTHSWSGGRWSANGFSRLTDINGFFTDPEAWAWQENLYRYIIARWSYSDAIGMWQLVSEVDGTNAYDQTDAWHQKVHEYFAENDPYRHLTTSSRSGDLDWEAGHLVMDAPQVHLYDLKEDAVGIGAYMAQWTARMWERGAKPNWVGEYGEHGEVYYPEMFHNAHWAALASGAAMTPAEWNDGGGFGSINTAMAADLLRFSRFVGDLRLAEWSLLPRAVGVSTEAVAGWAMVGPANGVVWVQDVSLAGEPIDQVRSRTSQRRGVTIEVAGMEDGDWTISPYNTWTGEYLEQFTETCAGGACSIGLPDFTSDIALVVRRN